MYSNIGHLAVGSSTFLGLDYTICISYLVISSKKNVLGMFVYHTLYLFDWFKIFEIFLKIYDLK